ncbi:hypothetical protein ES708_14151 [subsurface metagenome]
MNPIELGKAIAEYGIPIITGICLALIVWLVRRLVNEQSNTNKSILGMFKKELKDLHKDGQKNARLNRKSITMITALTEYLNLHFNNCVEKVNCKKKVKKKNGQK